jgi:starvation-inducible DNA-binding protein
MPAARRTSTAQSSTAQYGVPGLGKQDAGLVIEILQDRLNALNDLALTLKHIHWNVVGRNSSRCTPCSTRRWTRSA